jgi:hypothetical protein
MAWCIKDWSRHFEKSDMRKCSHARWVPMPNKHDGKSYRRIAAHPDGATIFAAWCLLLELASKAPVRGVLADEDGDYTAEVMSLKTGFPQSVFTTGVEYLAKLEIGWIYDNRPDASGRRPEASRLQDMTGQDRTFPLNPPKGEGAPAETREPLESGVDPSGFIQFWAKWPRSQRKRGKTKCLRKWKREGLEQSAPAILATLERCKASGDWRRGFVPLPMTWLNDTPWLTDPAEMVGEEPREDDEVPPDSWNPREFTDEDRALIQGVEDD